jgi:DNA invertase Pin-like site-specific DNA recombinase
VQRSSQTTKPDRLARSTSELLAIEADLSKRGVGLVVLSMGGERLDTRTPTPKLMLTILAGVATWEREIMLERQREGIAKAKAEGKYKGRKPTVGLQAATIRAMAAEGTGPAYIARQLNVARSSVYRVLGSAAAPVDGSGGMTGDDTAQARGADRKAAA